MLHLSMSECIKPFDVSFPSIEMLNARLFNSDFDVCIRIWIILMRLVDGRHLWFWLVYLYIYICFYLFVKSIKLLLFLSVSSFILSPPIAHLCVHNKSGLLRENWWQIKIWCENFNRYWPIAFSHRLQLFVYLMIDVNCVK